MQTKFKDGKWQITTSKTEMEKLDSMLGWLMPLTELSTPIKEEATTAMERLEEVRHYLRTNAHPTKETT